MCKFCSDSHEGRENVERENSKVTKRSFHAFERMTEELVEKHNGPVSIQQSDNAEQENKEKTNTLPKTTKKKKIHYVLKRLGLSEAPDCTTGRS